MGFFTKKGLLKVQNRIRHKIPDFFVKKCRYTEMVLEYKNYPIIMKYRDIFGYLIEYFLGCNVPNSYTRNHQHDSGIQENYNTP